MSGHSADHRRARWLVGATLGWDLVEGGVGLVAGILAGSVALTSFGLDSLIEVAAAGVLLHRLGLEARGADDETIARREHAAHRFIGWTFLALAIYVALKSATALIWQTAPSESPTGLVLAALAIVIMPLLAWGKLRVAKRIGSRALAAEAKESLACAWLSVALLLGLGAHMAFGWWWADPVAALLMVPWLVNEGREGLEEEDEDEDED